MKKHIPNLLTCGNFFCGCLGVNFAYNGNLAWAAYMIGLAGIFDFFDGFVARLLNVSSPIGKELDSLADMVTSGLVPGIIMFNLLTKNQNILDLSLSSVLVPFFGLVLTLGACYRLAKFNIDTRQLNSFIGLPTPAMSLFVISLPLIQQSSEIEFIQNLISNNYFLCGITLLLTYLMNAELPLFSLKFKEYSVKNNAVKYLFLLISLLLIFCLEFLSIPLIVLLYVLLSMIINYRKTRSLKI